MSLYIASLNSGSNGNCYYISNGTEAVLVDAGISCRETEKRMKLLGLQITHIKAIFISHEHGDHISGAETLSRKYDLPVYITTATHKNCRLKLQPHLVFSFDAHTPTTLGSLTITAFRKFHDADDPHSFVITSGAVKVGVFTDIGRACTEVIHYFKQCHAVFLEANYCPDMLAAGSYPYHLKKRISGGHGHLSNAEALALFTAHRPAFMSHLLLSHLSKNNNKPELVERLFAEVANGINIIVASRYHATEIYHIQAQSHPVAERKKLLQPKPAQLTLF